MEEKMVKDEWEVEQAKIRKEQQKGFDSLTDGQKECIKKTFETLRKTLQMIEECKDLYISDVRDIETAYWDMYSSFNFNKKND